MTSTAMPAATSAVAEHKRRTILAIIMTCTAYAAFNIGDAGIKVLAQKFGWAQIMVVNGVMIIAIMVLYGAITQGRAAFKVHNPKWVFIRSIFATCTTIANIICLPHITLTTFYTLVFTSPFWVAILSAIFMGEKLEPRRMTVIFFGFCVIAYILRPGSDIFSLWSFLALGSAFLYSCSVLTIRYLGTRESRVMIISTGSALGVLVTLPFISGDWVSMSLWDVLLFADMALVGAIGILCITHAFQTAPSAAVIAPFHYTQMVWGALLGYFLFKEIPGMSTMVGGGLLILGGLCLIYLESKARPDALSDPARAQGWFSRLRAYNPTQKSL